MNFGGTDLRKLSSSNRTISFKYNITNAFRYIGAVSYGPEQYKFDSYKFLDSKSYCRL